MFEVPFVNADNSGLPNPGVTTGPSTPESFGGFGSALGGVLLGYIGDRAHLDVEQRADTGNVPDIVDAAMPATGAAAVASGVVANISPLQWALLGVAGVLAVVLIARVV